MSFKVREAKREYQRRYHEKNKERVNRIARERYRKRLAAGGRSNKAIESDKRWRAANRERCRASTKAWYAANREKVIEKDRIRRLANPDKYRAVARARRLKDPAKHAACVRLWRALNPDRWRQIIRRANGKRRETERAIYSD